VIALQPVVDPAQVSVGQTFTREYLAETAPRFAELVSQVAGTSPTNFRRVLGGTPQDNAYLLDGQDATHWFQRFPAPAAFSMPFDVVQEAAVHSAGFEAEYGQATGGVVNVVTRSGGNRFSGTVDVRYTDTGLAGSGEHYNPDSEPSEGHDGSVTLGGPVVRDKLWFFTALVDRMDEFVVSDSPVPTIREERYYLAKAS
jgi:outer membrane receptor protein involved in Fe transport